MHAAQAQREDAQSQRAAQLRRTARELAAALTTSGIAARIEGDDDAPAHQLANFDEAKAGDITFIRTAPLARRWNACDASTALISEAAFIDTAHEKTSGRALIVVPDADLALNEVLRLLAPASTPRNPGVDATAVLHPSAKIGSEVHIGPLCVIEAGAVIGNAVVMLAGAYVGPEAHIGSKTMLHPGARVLDRCRIGASCILHSGVVIGADGFGYRPAPIGRGVVKIPHIGDVVLGDDVEVGANTCIDRAKFGTTTIGSGTKIDNLVQIAHNCRIGRSCIICGETGLAGSVTLGDGVVLGAKVGIADNLNIGSGARIGASSGVMTDVPAGASYLGSPAMPANEARRTLVELRRLGRGKKRSPF